jgi:hypothetical protein
MKESVAEVQLLYPRVRPQRSMTLLGNAVQLNKFSLSQCGAVGRKQNSRKAKGKKNETLF